jgi:hypothetical protein
LTLTCKHIASIERDAGADEKLKKRFGDKTIRDIWFRVG